MGWKNQCKHFKINKKNTAIWGEKISASTLKSTKRI